MKTSQSKIVMYYITGIIIYELYLTFFVDFLIYFAMCVELEHTAVKPHRCLLRIMTNNLSTIVPRSNQQKYSFTDYDCPFGIFKLFFNNQGDILSRKVMVSNHVFYPFVSNLTEQYTLI